MTRACSTTCDCLRCFGPLPSSKQKGCTCPQPQASSAPNASNKPTGHHAGRPHPQCTHKAAERIRSSSAEPQHPTSFSHAHPSQKKSRLPISGASSPAAPMKRRGQPPAPKAKGKAKKSAEEAGDGTPQFPMSCMTFRVVMVVGSGQAIDEGGLRLRVPRSRGSASVTKRLSPSRPGSGSERLAMNGTPAYP